MKFEPTEEQIRLVGRAIGDLRRGFGIVLLHMGEAFWIQAAEAWDYELRDDTPPGSGRLILTGERAKHSGLDGEVPALLTIQTDGTHELDDYVNQLLPISRAQIIPEPEQLMQAATMLTKQAGWRPLVYMSQGEESIPSDVTIVDAGVALRVLNQPADLIELTSHAVNLPLALSEGAKVRAFRDIATGITHLAILIGNPLLENAPLCRVHSSCMTGDILGSLRCDCGNQLHASIQCMEQAGAGVLLYLNQEGRGIGLAHKIHAYQLQDQGNDTVDANEMLGFLPDERDFGIAATILKMLEVECITLLSNNPLKQHTLEQSGIQVKERKPLVAGANAFNQHYLDTKRARMGHV